MKTRRMIIMLAMAFLLSGCGARQAQIDTLNSWIGAQQDELLQVWGKPTGSYIISGEDQIFEYLNDVPVTFNSYGKETTYHYRYLTRFRIGATGEIKGWTCGELACCYIACPGRLR